MGGSSHRISIHQHLDTHRGELSLLLPISGALLRFDHEKQNVGDEEAFKAKVLVAFGLAAEWVANEKARAVRRAKNNVSRRICSDGVFGKTATCVWNRRQCLFV